MSKVKSIYKILRSIVMTLVVSVALLYLALYIVLSLPSVQDKIKVRIEKETSDLLCGNLEIGHLSFSPFSEVALTGVALSDSLGQRCAAIGKVSAGIDLWQLIASRKIVFNYALISGLDARISQAEKDGALNIQFLIDALSPKDKNKPPTKFDLRFRNVVIRDSKASFAREWMTDTLARRFPPSTISLTNLRMDLSIPALNNDDYRFDLRNLECKVNDALEIRHIGAEVEYIKGKPDEGKGLKTPDRIKISGLTIELPGSRLDVGKVDLALAKDMEFHDISIEGEMTPADLQTLYPPLGNLRSKWNLGIFASAGKDFIELNRLSMLNPQENSSVDVEAAAYGINNKDSIEINLEKLEAKISTATQQAVKSLLPGNMKLPPLLASAGDIGIDLTGNISVGDQAANAEGEIRSRAGNVNFEADIRNFKSKKMISAKATADASDLHLGILAKTDKLGKSTFSIEADITGMDENASGKIDLEIAELSVNNQTIKDISVSADKEDKSVSFAIDTSDPKILLSASGVGELDGPGSNFDVNMVIERLSTEVLGISGALKDSEISGTFSAKVSGNTLDNATGQADISDFLIIREDGKKLQLTDFSISSILAGAEESDDPHGINRKISLASEWIDASLDGRVIISDLAGDARQMLSKILPSLLDGGNKRQTGWSGINQKGAFMSGDERNGRNNFKFNVTVKGNPEPYEFFNLPLRPLSDVKITGLLNAEGGAASLNVDTKHIQQGSNKLIRDTRLACNINAAAGVANVSGGTVYPAKKGDVQLAVSMKASNDAVYTQVLFNPTMQSSLKGSLGFNTRFARYSWYSLGETSEETPPLSVSVGIIPSSIVMSGKIWNVSDGQIDYEWKKINVKDFRVEHDKQYLRIDGNVSENPDDKIRIKLKDIDLDYIFGMLNINYVSFGGMATGDIEGSRLLTKSPTAYTRYLRVKGLSYNGAVLGDGDLAADYISAEQEVGIYAVIKDPLTSERRASIDGGIWVTRDSLSFTFDADKVNLAFMKPFVSAFCSDLKGRGSGKCKLYGTFSDIDLVGSLYADTVAMKLDFTNSWYYAGRDSVMMGKGLITVPPLTLYDRNGNTAEFSGWLRHRYFHEPVFDFKIRDARHLLCYDTNEKINPLWYGTIYGSGSGQITGRPGLVDISMDMTTGRGSSFTYVISDSEEIDEYSFLTFTDTRKARAEAEKVDTVPHYLHQFMKKKGEEEGGSSDVVLSLRGTVTPDVAVTIVMDPKGGDKITARGGGGIQMDYTSADNNMRMIGKYVLDEGNYNFTLQDIIIKNFVIRRGSTISFNGDPMDANLDIAATYRVNTNLTDLDKSFATDKELNRTNVPVDALLLVTGPMTQPDINFDIELPTLTADVERKVKSIVSTNDMMSRQIIYLLALNRFYTPEYTGNTSSGAEWSSMASSTISSQLSNILSQMTDKLSVAPSFRSDKGDFTDMEFDLALSSRLLNNRLLINGNFGYRDRSTSTTQFVGDFDIEYLLSRNGNLRLKAYNHFNDQNYYLRSALTTQGVGVLYRWDFDRLFKKMPSTKLTTVSADSVPTAKNDSTQQKNDKK